MARPNADDQFHDLFDRNQGRWIGIARSYATASNQEDLLQEILLQVWRSLSTHDGKAHIDTWAYRVALNTALSWNRKQRRRSERLPRGPTFLDCLPSTFAGTEESEMRLLDQFMASLRKSERAVLLLYMDSLSQEDAASILGISPTAFRVRVHRLKRKFEQTFLPEETYHES